MKYRWLRIALFAVLTLTQVGGFGLLAAAGPVEAQGSRPDMSAAVDCRYGQNAHAYIQSGPGRHWAQAVGIDYDGYRVESVRVSSGNCPDGMCDFYFTAYGNSLIRWQTVVVTGDNWSRIVSAWCGTQNSGAGPGSRYGGFSALEQGAELPAEIVPIRPDLSALTPGAGE
ncbi:MAG: hypothetical protein HY329_04845 [Chloroflexi bacterium]|nr:hypothetical protein [Chloroflexota bacterium]